MKRYITFISIVLSVVLGIQVNANNEGQLKGRLIDSDTKEGIHCANVMIVIDDELISGTVSGVKGDYLIESITPGIYSVKASFVGYKTVKIDSVFIKANRVTELDIEIEKSNVFLEGVEVKSYSIPFILKDCTSSGGTATAEEISTMPGYTRSNVEIKIKPGQKAYKGSNVNTLFEAYKNSGGAEAAEVGLNLPNSTSQALAITLGGVPSQYGDNIGVRGQRGSGTTLYVDGMRLSGTAAYVPECAVQKVAVYLGGTPAEYENDISIEDDLEIYDIPDVSYVSSYVFSPPAPPVTRIYEREALTEISENEFVSPFDEPLSTFSIDVDRAAYSTMRRMLNYGYAPPPNDVRIEEMINYFDYSYEKPKGQPFSVYNELAACPWNPESSLLHIGIQGEEIEIKDRQSNNLVFLVDVSGSMSGPDKLPLLVKSLKLLVRQLNENDKVAVVVYAGSSGLVLPSTSCDQKGLIYEKLDDLYASGSTAGGAGIQLAYKVAVDNFIEDGNNRVILATDGDFNVGITDNNELLKLIDDKKETGVFLSVLGFGSGNYKDDRMEILADHGNGNYAYIDCMKEAKKVLVTEMAGTLYAIAKDVKLQLEFNPAIVKSYRLVGYENRIMEAVDFDNDKKDAGEIGAGHTVTAIYEVQFADDNANFRQKLRYLKRDKSVIIKSEELAFMKIRYKEPKESKSQLLQFPIANTVVNEPSENFGFSASVAGFGLLLRGSEFIDDAFDYEQVLEMAKKYKGDDEEGYRSEFIQLVKLAEEIDLADNQ
jgi:Ca-activated chloride channel family protein